MYVYTCVMLFKHIHKSLCIQLVSEKTSTYIHNSVNRSSGVDNTLGNLDELEEVVYHTITAETPGIEGTLRIVETLVESV